MSALYLSAAHKSCGKTVVAIGITAAAKRRGIEVDTFKKGPDYIDAGWLSAAAESACTNLDFHTQTDTEIIRGFAKGTREGLRLVEGTKGLHDGVDPNGGDSNAALARLLGLPVVLVLDTRGMTRGIAPLVLGLKGFEPDVDVRGVILNRVGGERHASKLRRALETYTDVECLGCIGDDPLLNIDERHLGLTTAAEWSACEAFIGQLAKRVESESDVTRMLEFSPRAPSVAIPTGEQQSSAGAPVRIGIAKDQAFSFYYPQDLEAMERAGAELVFFDTLHDATLPLVDALMLGGGFPEAHAEALSANQSMRQSIAASAVDGLPIYGECGGLMYLARSVSTGAGRYDMCGVLPIDVRMEAKPVGRGYVRLSENGRAPWGRIARDSSATLAAHEFHYSRATGVGDDVEYAYTVERGFGVDGDNDGLVVGNVFASYAHLRHTERTPWVNNFINWVRNQHHCSNPQEYVRHGT